MGLTGRQFDQIVKISRRTGITKISKTTNYYGRKFAQSADKVTELKNGTSYIMECGNFEVIYFKETQSFYTTNGRR